MTAKFEPLNANMKFELQYSGDTKKTVTVSKVSPTAEADKVYAVSNAISQLFDYTVNAVKRTETDSVVNE